MKKLDKYIQKTNFDKAYIGDAEGQEDLSPTETARHIDKIKIILLFPIFELLNA